MVTPHVIDETGPSCAWFNAVMLEIHTAPDRFATRRMRAQRTNGPSRRLTNLACRIAERNAQPDSGNLDGARALGSYEVKRVVMRLRPAEAARARIETHTPER